jgi:uncharacterized membrane protein
VDKATHTGRAFVAISMAVFGVLQIVGSDFIPGIAPVPAWVPGRTFLVYLSGVALVAAGVSVIASAGARAAAALAGFGWFLCVLLHVPRLVVNPSDGAAWTTGSEALALCGGAIVLAGALSAGRQASGALERITAWAAPLGRYFVAVPMPVFGILHFVYADIVARAVPAWIPGKPFWVYLTGVAHIAAGLGIVTRVHDRLAATLWGLMVGLWVVILHTPRVVANPNGRNEWTSTFLALAMCGGSLLVAGALAKEDRTERAGLDVQHPEKPLLEHRS